MHYINSGDSLRQTLIRFAMYLFLGLITIILTVLSVMAIQGYDFDPETGQIIINGLMLVDSSPDGANVYINGELERDKTPSKFALPQGSYDIGIWREGYRNWTNQVEVTGQQVFWLYHPKLIPETINTTVIDELNGLRIFAQSWDNRQILINTAEAPLELLVLRAGAAQSEIRVAIPPRLLGDPETTASLKLLDWHNSGRYLLIEITQGKQKRVAVIDSADSAASLVIPGIDAGNVSSIFFSPTPGKLVVVEDSQLRLLDFSENPVNSTGLDENTSFITRDFGGKNYGVRQIQNEYQVFYIEDDQIRVLYTTTTTVDSIAAARYERDDFVSVVRGKNVSIFRNPQDDEQSVAEKVFNFDEVPQLSYSTDGRLLLLAGSNSAVVYDFERSRSYPIVDYGTADNLQWLDAPRLTAVDEGELLVMDFDGANVYQIVDSSADRPVFTDEKSTYMYSIGRSSVTDRLVLQRSNLITE